MVKRVISLSLFLILATIYILLNNPPPTLGQAGRTTAIRSGLSDPANCTKGTEVYGNIAGGLAVLKFCISNGIFVPVYSGLNPNTIMEFDDFLSGAVTQPVSKLGWNNRGAGSLSYLDSTWPHIGALQISTGTASSNAESIELSGSSAIRSLGILGSNASWDSRFIFQLLENAAETAEPGFTDTVGAATPGSNSSIFVRYITGTDTIFTFTVCQVGVCTISTANSVSVDTNWHDVRIYSLIAGEIIFSIDGGSTTCFTAASSGGCSGATTVVNSAHVPTTNMIATYYLQTNAAVNKRMLIDYFGFSTLLSR